jgi:hypothetical protein
MLQKYTVWVVIDPTNQDWFSVEAETIQDAAEVASLTYDRRLDVDFALTKESTVVQVLVRDPANETRAYTFEVSCTLNPYYEITADTGLVTLG